MSAPPPEGEETRPDPQAARNSIVVLAILVEGGLVGLAIAGGWLLDQPPLSRFVLDPAGVVWGLAATLPLIGAYLVMNRWPIGPLRSIKAFTEQVICPALAPCTRIDLLGISCLAGLGEEMLFRGLLQDALLTRMPWYGALAIASVLFGLLHAITPAYVILAGLMGAYLGGLYMLSDNLLAPIITHAAYDFTVLIWALGPEAPYDEDVDDEEDEEDEDELE